MNSPSPSVPDAVKPKVPVSAQAPSTTNISSTTNSTYTPTGRDSLIAAGRLDRRANTLKSSLLG